MSAAGGGRSRRRNVPLIAVGVVAVAFVALALAVALRGNGAGRARPEPVGSIHGAVAITSFDGVTLGAQVSRPAGAGPFPLVVMPASYGSDSTQYAAIARHLRADGFVTVSYTQRGFHNSGGAIDLAGANTQRDARTVIDWSLRHTPADPRRIGMLGVSYGAGISLLTAAHDRRVRAVVALSAWSDMARAFHPNDTTSVGALGLLLSNARLGGATTTLARQLRADPFGNGGRLDAFARPRSPSTYVADLNRNRPAVMIANGWEDSIFAPTMLVDFYDRLTTPKRLQLARGDHGGPEHAMLAGTSPSPTGDAAYAWLRHYVSGTANGIERTPPVQLEDVPTRTTRGYASWPHPQPLRTSLDDPASTGPSISTTPAAWRTTLDVGHDSSAGTGPMQPSAGDDYRLMTTRLPGTDRTVAVWRAAPVTTAIRVAGTPHLTVSVSSTSKQATLFTYLYDVAPDGTASLMTMTPYTASHTSSSSKQVGFALEPIVWTIPAGHSLAVVVDTVDPRWYQAASAGSRITLLSTPGAPAGLAVPIG